MELKFTFEDGSEAYLQHYGVKGMKWKDHVAKAQDEEKKAKRAKKLQNISKSLTLSAKGSEAKRAKARVKAHYAADRNTGPVEKRTASAMRRGRKLRNTHAEYVIRNDGSVTSLLSKDRKVW